jgi:glutaminyl-tRNA synthetase
LREDLNKTAPRVMAVLDPIKLVLRIIQKIKKWLEAENNQKMKARDLSTFSKELFIEREDF